MKKITLITLLLILPFVASAQLYDFTTTADGWTPRVGFNTVLTHTGVADDPLVATFPDTETAPRMELLGGNIAAANKYCVFTLKNNSPNGNINVAAILDPAPHAFTNRILKPNSGFETYAIDMSTNANWGLITTMATDIRFYLKNGTGADWNLTAGSFEITRLEFTSTKPMATDFSFLGLQNAFFGAAGYGDVTVTSTGSGLLLVPAAGTDCIRSTVFNVDADANKYVHVRLLNDGANDVLTIETDTAPTGEAGSIAITPSSGFQDYVIDLTGSANWSGIADDIRILPKITASGLADIGPNVVFEHIIFSNSATLSVDKVNYKDDASITVYPNPASSALSINTPRAIEKIEVFNLLGQTTLSQKSTSKKIDISSLSQGVYILKIHQENNIISTKRFVKK